MSNPWSQAYEDLRKPYLEGKMAKKDYDGDGKIESGTCLLYTSPSPRDLSTSRMPSSA